MRRLGMPSLLAVATVMVVGACGGPAVTSAPGASAPAPSGSPIAVPAPQDTAAASPSALPTSTVVPSPTPTNPPSYNVFPELGWVNKFVMRVAVSDLNVRRSPSTSGVSEGKAPKGGLFMVYDWPVQANGYTWYYGFTLLTSQPGVIPDLPTPIETGYDEVLGGWMATGTEDTPFLVPLAPRCPGVRNLLNVAAMLDFERVTCLASDSIELEGSYGCGGCGGEWPGSFEPVWLASPLEFTRLSTSGDDGLSLALHFPPDGPGLPAEGTNIRVRGHFSDARSTTCRMTELGRSGALDVKIDDDAAEQWCRARFVVESYQVIGS